MILVGFCSLAQRGIGTNDPHESAVMDIVSSNRGLLIPRVGLKDLSNKRVNGTDSPESLESALIYNNGSATSGVTEKGFYYWTGPKWARLLTDNDNININNDVLAKTYTSSEVATQNLGNDDMLPLGGTFIVKASGVFGSEKTLEVVLPTITADHHRVMYTIVRHKDSVQHKLKVRVLPEATSTDIIDGELIPTSVMTPRLLILQAEYVAGGTSRWHVIDRTLFKTEHVDKTFGGSDRDRARSIIQTRDGGYLIGASTRSKGVGMEDFWLIKTDAYGNKQWEKTFGGTGFDFLESVIQTSDGGYVLGGYTRSKGAGNSDFWLVKTDASGNESWDETFGGSSWDECRSVIQTRDGGYALGGYTSSKGAGGNDFWLVKTDASGTKTWDKTFGGSSWDECRSVIQTRDGGYALGGYTASKGAGGNDFWLVKTDASGTKTWDKTFGGTPNEVCNSIVQTPDGGYILAGRSSQRSGVFFMVKTDKDGNESWNHIFGGSSVNEECHSVVQTSDGGYLMGGTTASKGAGLVDFWLIKTDARGNKQWDKTFGGSANDECRSVIQTDDGGYAMVGRTLSKGAGDVDVWIVTYKP